MLYDQIRYADEIRMFYKLRGRQSGRVGSSIVQSLGYSKYSNHFYVVKRRLRDDGVLDGRGKLVETSLNAWLAELPELVDEEARSALGRKGAYTLFLATVLNPEVRPGELAKELGSSRRSVYWGASRLIDAGLVRRNNAAVHAIETPAKEWLSKYLAACIDHADFTNDIQVLFRAVPAYINGARAYFAFHRESGMPIGRADMAIATPKPFMGFWEDVVREVKYFRDYQKEVVVATASPSVRVVWKDKLPFNSRVKLSEVGRTGQRTVSRLPHLPQGIHRRRLGSI
ncbi:MAG: hypothetical protein JRN21_09840 [Nitrososphaerota archaeon]|nr:hypothetical protein [Nitrososphaerota archaeon]